MFVKSSTRNNVLKVNITRNFCNYWFSIEVYFSKCFACFCNNRTVYKLRIDYRTVCYIKLLIITCKIKYFITNDYTSIITGSNFFTTLLEDYIILTNACTVLNKNFIRRTD